MTTEAELDDHSRRMRKLAWIRNSGSLVMFVGMVISIVTIHQAQSVVPSAPLYVAATLFLVGGIMFLGASVAEIRRLSRFQKRLLTDDALLQGARRQESGEVYLTVLKPQAHDPAGRG